MACIGRMCRPSPDTGKPEAFADRHRESGRTNGRLRMIAGGRSHVAVRRAGEAVCAVRRTSMGHPVTPYLKLCTRLEMVRLHPSTSTNSNSLKGREIIAGGNMNMPMLMSTEATTASMMMNGR